MKLAKVSTSHIQAVTGTTFVSTLSSLLFGYCTAVISGVVGAIDHNFIAPRGMRRNGRERAARLHGVRGRWAAPSSARCWHDAPPSC